MNQHWWKDRKEAVAALFVGLLAGALLTVGVPALAAPAAVQVPDGQFNLACSVIGGQVSCLGNLPTATPTPTASPTSSPTASPTAVSTTTPPVTTPPPTTPPTTPPPVTSMDPAWWPANAGVPPFATLTPYTGPCTILTANTVISNKVVNCRLVLKARGVVVQNSRLNGGVDAEDGQISISRSDVDGQQYQGPAVGWGEITLNRVNVHGGEHSVLCAKPCTIIDSWLHGQYMPYTSDWHLNAFISNGGHDMLLRHNALQCTAVDGPGDGGCTADASIFGDFGPNSRITLDQNLFMASTGSYCVYGGTEPSKAGKPDHIVITNNVFQRGSNGRCASYGPVTSFDKNAPGNVWSNNTWDNGGAVNP